MLTAHKMLSNQLPDFATCKYCAREFEPARPLAQVCSPRCAVRKGEADKKAKKAAERALTKARREAIKTIPERIKEAQHAFNALVRARDIAQPCISCGKPPGDMSKLHAGRDAGHYRSIGSASHLRFHPDNCHAQCVRCNQWGAGMAVDYRIGLIARIGVERVEALECDNTPHKWAHAELIAIRADYRARLKRMEAQL